MVSFASAFFAIDFITYESQSHRRLWIPPLRSSASSAVDFFSWLTLYSQAIDHPFNSVLEMNHIEINQKSHFSAAELQIAEKLSLVYRRQHIYGLQFNEHHILHYQIRPIPNIHFHAIVKDGHWNFRYYIEPAFPQF